MQRHGHADVIVEVAVGRHARTALRDRMAAVISFAVVLPLLPPTPTIGIEKSSRHARASCCSALQRVRRLRSAAARTSATLRSTMAPTAPRACAAATKSAPSNVRPAQRDEQRARRQRAAVGRHHAVRPVLADQASCHRARRVLQAALHARGPQDPARLLPVAENAARGAVDLVILMALAGDEHHILADRLLERGGDRRAAIVNDSRTGEL